MELSRTLFGWMLLPALVLAQELGGTGRTHDWMLSRRVRDAVQLTAQELGKPRRGLPRNVSRLILHRAPESS